MSDGYDPQKSRVAEDTLADFLRAPLTGDLTEVPGIGPAAVTKLAAGDDATDSVENTFQLIGKFLMFKVRLRVFACACCSHVRLLCDSNALTRCACRKTRTRTTTGCSTALRTAMRSGSGSSRRASRRTAGMSVAIYMCVHAPRLDSGRH